MGSKLTMKRGIDQMEKVKEVRVIMRFSVDSWCCCFASGAFFAFVFNFVFFLESRKEAASDKEWRLCHAATLLRGAAI